MLSFDRDDLSDLRRALPDHQSAVAELFCALLDSQISVSKFIRDRKANRIVQAHVFEALRSSRPVVWNFPDDVIVERYRAVALAASTFQDHGNGGARNCGKGELMFALFSPDVKRPSKQGDLVYEQRVIQVKAASHDVNGKLSLPRVSSGTVTAGSFRDKFASIVRKHKLRVSAKVKDIPSFLPELDGAGGVKRGRLGDQLIDERKFHELDEQVSASKDPAKVWHELLSCAFDGPRRALTEATVGACLKRGKADPAALCELFKDAACDDEEALLFFTPGKLLFSPTVSGGVRFQKLHIRRSYKEEVRVYVVPRWP